MPGVCLYGQRVIMERKKRAVGNVSFRWWRKPENSEKTTSHLQVASTDNLLMYG